ncbi:transposase domain-containing protein, partial [Streptomyces sp. NPDC057430]|uniref:transposase domain-containing protein n=1 Tax=Streptomyces sp. NPDC057430 TaxID=3346131 RepID=UPI00367B687D
MPAAGYLGEPAQVVTPSLVDGVLATTERVRVRKLSARVVMYFVLAMTLFGACGCRGVRGAAAAPRGPDVLLHAGATGYRPSSLSMVWISVCALLWGLWWAWRMR